MFIVEWHLLLDLDQRGTARDGRLEARAIGGFEGLGDSEGCEGSEYSEYSEGSEGSEDAETWKTPNTPKAPKTPMTLENPETSDSPETPSTPKTPSYAPLLRPPDLRTPTDAT